MFCKQTCHKKNSFPSFIGQKTMNWPTTATRLISTTSPLLSAVRKYYRQMAWSWPTGRPAGEFDGWSYGDRAMGNLLCLNQSINHGRYLPTRPGPFCECAFPSSLALLRDQTLHSNVWKDNVIFIVKCSLSTTPAFSRYSVSETGFISFFRWQDTVRTHVTLVCFSYGTQRKRSLYAILSPENGNRNRFEMIWLKKNTLDGQWQWLLHTSVNNLQSLAVD